MSLPADSPEPSPDDPFTHRKAVIAARGQASAAGTDATGAAKVPTLAAEEVDFSCNIRGDSINPVIDASAPLIAMILRVNDLGQFDDTENLRKNCLNEIESIELELQRLGYDRVAITAHRYCLCSAIDEAVMRRKWGRNSTWSQHSLLSTLHDETQGGEKFFAILKRVMLEPERYLHLIESLYLLLCLGYEGRHEPTYGNRAELEALIKETHDVIRKTKGTPEPLRLAHLENVVAREHRVKRQTPIALVVAAMLLLMGALYAGFFHYTEQQVDLDLQKIVKILNLK